MLSLVLPKGSLEVATLALFQDADLAVVRSSDVDYRATISDPRVSDVRILRPQEIPGYVAEGRFDLGVTGRDWIEETSSDVVTLAELPYSKVSDAPVRIVGTADAIASELMVDGFVQRYKSASGVDGLPEGEGAFLPCSFWLADNYSLMGRTEEAHALFERLIALVNDVGLIAEEYDAKASRMLGNFPQAMTHVSLINTAYNLSGSTGPAHVRSGSAKSS